MKQTSRYTEEVTKLLASRDDENQEPTTDQEQIYDVWTIPGKKGKKGIIILRADEDEQVIDSILTEPDTAIPLAPTVHAPTPEQDQDETRSTQVGLLTISLFLLLALSSIVFQINLILNPIVATITIIPKSQTVTLTGTLQLGRVIPPITLSQERTVPTTGKGHQDAKQAQGFITFYNGQSSQVTLSSGTTLTGNDGTQIVTDADANIPPANPPSLGQATVPAHATNAGSAGNIQALDINTTVSSAVFVKNLNAFTGGQDERNFQTVAQSDINNAATPLKTTLNQSMQDTLTGQLKSGETLIAPHCTPTTTADHQVGQEAKEVKVTVSLTCSGIAYNSQELEARVTQLLTSQAIKKVGTGYGLLGNVSVTVNQATVTTSHPTIAFSSSGVWVYGLSDAAQQRIKHLIAGKTKQDALHILASQPGIERATTQWDENTKLPKDARSIHLVIYAGI